MNPLLAPLDFSIRAVERVFDDLRTRPVEVRERCTGGAGAVQQQAAAAVDLLRETLRLARSGIGVLERLERQAGRVIELGERLDARAEAVLDLGERIDSRAEAILGLGERIDSRAEAISGWASAWTVAPCRSSSSARSSRHSVPRSAARRTWSTAEPRRSSAAWTRCSR